MTFSRKIVVLVGVILGSILNIAAQTDADAVWNRANTLYANGEYEAALISYDSIANEGLQSARLYFNMGNAHFKLGHKGQAILFYHRAQRLDPGDKDTAYNLAYANSFTKDRIESVPRFFLAEWFDAVRNLLSSNAWASMSIVALALTLAMVSLYLLARSRKARKWGLGLAIVFLLLNLLTVSFSASSRRRVLDHSHAVVLSPAASVKSSPDRSSKDMFILHEGTLVKVLNRLGDWVEIEIADGNEGWITSTSIEII